MRQAFVRGKQAPGRIFALWAVLGAVRPGQVMADNAAAVQLNGPF